MSNQVNSSDRENQQLLSFKSELPHKLRLLSFAAKNRDFNEVGIIAHHIHQLFDHMEGSPEQDLALQLTNASLMQPTEAQQKVSEFTDLLFSFVSDKN